MKDEFLFKNRWISLKKRSDRSIGLKGYVYSHESRCNGQIISILPYRRGKKGVEFLFRLEMTPCWNVYEQTLSTITGGVENNFPREDAIRELHEETGYVIQDKDLIFLGNSYGSKSSDTVYSLFSVDLTNKRQGKAIGDGSSTEAKGSTFWGATSDVLCCVDPQASVIYSRLSHRKTSGLILGKFDPPHAGHLFLIQEAKKVSEEIVIAVGSSYVDSIDPSRRVAWLTKMAGKNTKVVKIPNNTPRGITPAMDKYWTIWRDNLRQHLPFVPEVIFSSEGYGETLAQYMGMRSVVVDKDRKRFPISATMICSDPKKYWGFIPKIVRPYYK